MANDVTLKVGVDSTEAEKGFKDIVAKSGLAAQQAQSSFSDVFKGSLIGGGVAGLASNAISAITSVATAAFDEYKELDKNIANIGTLGVEASGLSLNKFEGLINELSTKAPDKASNIANGVYNAISAGITGSEEEIVKFVETASRVGVAGVADTNAAVNGLTSVVNAYGLGAAGAEQTSNIFFATIKAGKTSFNELNAGLANIVPAASAAGISFDEVGATIAKLTTVGIPTAQATTQLRAAIIELQKPGKPLQEILAKVGLSAANMGEQLKKPAAEGGGLINTLQMVEKAAKESGKSLTQVFSSSEAGSAALSLTGKNAASALSIFEGVQKDVADGVADKAYDAASKSIDVQMAIVKNNIQALFNDIFANIDIAGGVQYLIDLFGKAKEIFASVFAGTENSGVDFSSMLQKVGQFVESYVLMVFRNMANLLKTVYEIGVFAFDTLVDALSPLGDALGGVEGATGGLASIMKFLFDVIKEVAKVIIDVLGGAISIVSNAIAFFINIINGVVSAFQTVSKWIDDVSNYFNVLFGAVNNGGGIFKGFQDIINSVGDTIKSIGDAIYNFGANIINQYFIDPIKAAIGWVDSIIKKVQDWVLSIPAVQKALGIIQSIIKGVGDFFTSTDNIIRGVKLNIAGVVFAIGELGNIAKTIFDNITSLNFSAVIDNIKEAPQRIAEAFAKGKKGADEYLKSQENASNAVKKLTKETKELNKEQAVVIPPADDTTKKKTEDDGKGKQPKPAKVEDPRIAAIEELIQAEKSYQEKALETQQKIANATTSGELTAEQKKKLYEDELARLQKILVAKEGLAEYDGKQFQSIKDIANITISEDGRVISGLKGKAGEIEKVREKASKFYNDIDNQILRLNTNLAKLTATENKDIFKDTFEFLKSSSETLRKTTTETLTTKFAFSVDEKVFDESIEKIKKEFEEKNNELKEIKVNGDKKQQEEIEKILQENLKRQETIEKEAATIRERISIERQTDANKRRLDLSLFDLKEKYEKEREENVGNFTKLDELETAYLQERAKLQEEYDRQNNFMYGVQSAFQMSMMEQFNISRLLEERRANQELLNEKRNALNQEESDLEKSLADRTITFEEYQQKIADIQQARIDAGFEQEKLGDQLLKELKLGGEKAIAQIFTDQGNRLNVLAQERINKQVALDAKAAQAKEAFDKLQNEVGTEQYIAAQKALQDAQDAAAKNDADVYGFRTSVLEEFAGKALNQFAQLAASGKASLADFGKVTVQLAFELLQKQIPIWVASIFGTEVSKLGFAGLATTAALTATLYGLFAAAQSAAGFKDGVVSLEGAGTETSDSIPAWLSKGESVITARATKQNKDELEWMNRTGLPLREFYRHQISQTSVNESGDIIHELRQLRVTTESLGVQINRNTRVQVDGVLSADGNSITAMIESNRKRNARRY